MIHVHDSNIIGDESWFHRILSKNRETKRAHSASITWEIFCFTKSLFSLKFWWNERYKNFIIFTPLHNVFTHFFFFFRQINLEQLNPEFPNYALWTAAALSFKLHTCSLAKMKINSFLKNISWNQFQASTYLQFGEEIKKGN